jgi:hypothetical protein
MRVNESVSRYVHFLKLVLSLALGRCVDAASLMSVLFHVELAFFFIVATT